MQSNLVLRYAICLTSRVRSCSLGPSTTTLAPRLSLTISIPDSIVPVVGTFQRARMGCGQNMFNNVQ